MSADADRIGMRHVLAGLLAATAAGPALAQDTGRLLTFGTSFGVIADDNPDLVPDGGSGTVDPYISTDFTLLRATRIQSLALAGSLQFRTGEDSDEGTGSSGGLAQSNLNLSYDRTSADAALGIDAALRRDKVDYLDPLEIDLDDDLIIDEIDAIGRTGIRLVYDIDAVLELRRRAPFGITLSAGASSVDYSDTGNAALTDEERLRAGLGLRFDLDPLLQVNADLGFDRYRNPEDGEEDRDETSLALSLSRSLPTGSIGLTGGFTTLDTGERVTFALGRGLETELWNVSAEIGATREVSGDVTPVAQIEVARELPTGSISASLRRSVRSDNDGEETILNAARADFARQINPTLTMTMGLAYVGTEGTGDNEQSNRLASANLGFQKTLTEDWSLNLGLSHRAEDDGNFGRASSNRVTLNLRRAFATTR